MSFIFVFVYSFKHIFVSSANLLFMLFVQCFEGIPPAYQKANRVVVPAAFRVTKLKPGRKYTVLGDLAKRVGWKYEEIVQKLEAKRIRLGKIAYAQKKLDAKLRAKAVEEVSKTDAIKKVLPTIQAFAF